MSYPCDGKNVPRLVNAFSNPDVKYCHKKCMAIGTESADNARAIMGRMVRPHVTTPCVASTVDFVYNVMLLGKVKLSDESTATAMASTDSSDTLMREHYGSPIS